MNTKLNMTKKIFLSFAFLMVQSSFVEIVHSQFKGRPATLISGGDPRPFSADILLNHHEYAEFRYFKYHFYSYSQFKNELGHLRPHWLKVLALKDALSRSDNPEGSWIIWIDDDMYIDDFFHPESILDRYLDAYAVNDKTFLLATTDCEDSVLLNTGILFLKKNNFSRALLEDWWAYRPLEDNCHHDEQAKLIQLLKDRRYHESGEVVILPQRAGELNLNTFLAKDDSKECFARDGDFLSQPAGATTEEKVMRLSAKVAEFRKSRPLNFGHALYSTKLYLTEYFNSFIYNLKVPAVQLGRTISSSAYDILTSEELKMALPVITTLTLCTLTSVFFLLPHF